MTPALRLLLGFAVTLATYWLLNIAFAFFPIFPWLLQRAVVGALALLLGIAAAWATRPDSPLRPVALVASAFKCGLACFALGFFGPMVLAPGANQGPMLGFFTGPAGFVAGGLYALVRALARGRGDPD